MDQSFIPECFVDTNLIETLVPPVTQYNHQKGCGTVTKVMKEKFADRFAVGIIDKDKQTVDYLKEFDLLLDEGSLLLFKHPKRHHYMIQVSPAMERFILENAQAADIDLHDYDLPTDMDLLKKASKTVNSKNEPRFKRLFKDMREQNAPGITKLAGWVQYLRNHGYNASIDELRNL